MVDTSDLKSVARMSVRVRLPPASPFTGEQNEKRTTTERMVRNK